MKLAQPFQEPNVGSRNGRVLMLREADRAGPEQSDDKQGKSHLKRSRL
jgi:hypothetical protein